MDWLAVVTALLGAATFALVLHAEIRRRRRAKPVLLRLNPYGNAEHPDGHKTRLWSLTNAGSEDAFIELITAVGCTIEPCERFPPITVVRQHDMAVMSVRTDDPSNAWLLIVWSHPGDRRWWHVHWDAAEPGAELEEELYRGTKHRGWLHYLVARLRHRRRTVRAVGPGGADRTRVRLMQKRIRQDLELATSIAMRELPSTPQAPEA